MKMGVECQEIMKKRQDGTKWLGRQKKGRSF